MTNEATPAQPDKDPYDAHEGDSKRVYTPPTLARKWGCSAESVISLIKAGRLLAFSVSPASCRRPRWRISPEAVRLYELAKQEPAVVKAPRRRKDPNVIQFFK